MTTDWFALHVKSRQEKGVSRILSSKGFEQFLPVYRSKRKWTDRVREVDVPLFPGYVFCRFKLESRIPVVTTPGVVGIVRCGRMFAAVDPAEIAALQTLPKSGDQIPESYRALVPKIIRLLGSHPFENTHAKRGPLAIPVEKGHRAGSSNVRHILESVETEPVCYFGR